MASPGVSLTRPAVAFLPAMSPAGAVQGGAVRHLASPPLHTDQDIRACPLYRLLSPPLRQQAEQQPHLWRYLHALPVEAIGVPAYYESLDRKLRELKNPNLVYPVAEGVYVHIYPDAEDSRDRYVAVEPGSGEELDALVARVEERLLDLVPELERRSLTRDRTEVLVQAIDQICTTHGGRRWLGGGRGRIRVTPAQLTSLRYRMIRDKQGMGALQPLLLDPYIEDISCSGVGELFVEHKIFGSLKSNIRFESFAELDRFVVALSEKIGRPVSHRAPIVDATLPDGSRINIVFGGEVSKRGSNFTIRKFAGTPMSVLDLIEMGSLDYQVAAYLYLVLGEGMSMFVAGETASGKTTLLNAITAFIPPNNKIVTIEDTPELQVPHPNWTREVVRGGRDGDATVTMFDLLRAALRQRPDQIIIGEIRGEEGLIAFQAMQTGHPCMATFHAASVEKLIQRLTGSPINVPKTYVDNLNVVIIQSAVRLPDGRIGRRVLSVSEIIGYDSASDSFSFVEVFRWNPADDRFEFTGHLNSYLLEYKIAPRRGLPQHRKRLIYDELERRARILQALHAKGITNYHALYRVLAKACRDGLVR